MITFRNTLLYTRILFRKISPQSSKLDNPVSTINLPQNQFKFLFQNKYFFGQNQPHQNPKLNPSQKSSQSSKKNFFLSWLYAKFTVLISWLRKVAQKIGLVLFIGAMGYLGVFFLFMGFYILAAVYLALYWWIKPKTNEKRILDKYKTAARLLKHLRVDQIIPTIKKAEQAVLNKIRNNTQMTQRVKGLKVHKQTIKNTKISGSIVNSRKIYPFKVYRKIYL